MRFDWDTFKDAENRRKHGISFSEAQELFESGVDYFEIHDENHSITEERFIAIGPIQRGLVLIVWTERTDEQIRIISARWANRREQGLYRKYMEGL